MAAPKKKARSKSQKPRVTVNIKNITRAIDAEIAKAQKLPSRKKLAEALKRLKAKARIICGRVYSFR